MRAVGLDREDAVHLGAQARVLQDPGGEGLVAWPIASMALARAAAESALRSLSGSLDLPATSKRVALFRFASVGVREEQPPHKVVGLLHHELGELQRAGADLGGHLAAVRLERLHEGQEPLRVVDLELEVRHGALAHGPLELGRAHVGVRVPELPPLAVLELHEARHEGAAGEAVGSVQPPRVPQELEPLAVHAVLYVRAEEGHELPAGRRGQAEALRHVRGVRAVQALPDLHARGGSPAQVVVRGKVVVRKLQLSPERHVSSSQHSLAAFSSGRATVTQAPLGMGSVIVAGYMASVWR